MGGGEPWPDTRVEALAAPRRCSAPRRRPLAREALAIERSLPAAGQRPLEPGLRALLLATHDVAARLTRPPCRAPRCAAGAGDAPLGEAEGGLPLADWKARAVPELPDEAFAARTRRPGATPTRWPPRTREGIRVLRDGDVLVQCRSAVGTLRGAQSPVTDPVSLRYSTARQPRPSRPCPGWSARDCALRAVAEHRSWLAAQAPRLYANDRVARPAAHRRPRGAVPESLDGERPSLALTAAATAEALAAEAEDGLAELPSLPRRRAGPAREVLEALRARGGGPAGLREGSWREHRRRRHGPSRLGDEDTDNIVVVRPRRRELVFVPRDLWSTAHGDRINAGLRRTAGHEGLAARPCATTGCR